MVRGLSLQYPCFSSKENISMSIFFCSRSSFNMLSNLFYTINFSVAIVLTTVTLCIGSLLTMIVLFHRRCQTILNLLRCNTVVTMMMHSILVLISSIFGLDESASHLQPACLFRAYCFASACSLICHSIAIQSISRLFYAVLYRYKFLLTWKAHWYLITISWCVSLSTQLLNFVFPDGFFVYERESRTCIGTTRKPIASLYCAIMALVVPVKTMFIVYSIILYRIRQSTRRVHAFNIHVKANTVIEPVSSLNAKRELKVMKTMVMIVGLMGCSGMLYILLVIWNLTAWSMPPEPLYLLSINTMALGVTILTVLFLLTTKEVNTVVKKYIRNLCLNR